MFATRRIAIALGAALLTSLAAAQAPRNGGTLNLIVNPEPPGINLGSA